MYGLSFSFIGLIRFKMVTLLWWFFPWNFLSLFIHFIVKLQTVVWFFLFVFFFKFLLQLIIDIYFNDFFICFLFFFKIILNFVFLLLMNKYALAWNVMSWYNFFTAKLITWIAISKKLEFHLRLFLFTLHLDTLD